MIVPTPTRFLYDLSHIYPATDGKPMAEGTTQYRYIVTIKGGLDIQYHDDPNVFVAGDLFWYPVEGNPKIRKAPDVMVALGRPKGERPSYLQWLEDNVPPQVVIEIQSPGNRKREMKDKFAFFERYGVQEYYLYDPQSHHLQGWLRTGSTLEEIPEMDGWVSPLLEIRFELSLSELRVFGRDGRQFVDVPELDAQREEAERRTELERAERQQAERRTELERAQRQHAERRTELERAQRQQAEQRAEQERAERQQAERRAERNHLEAEMAHRKAERLAAQLRALGIEPEQ
jgi:Uma2 family endonuclease